MACVCVCVCVFMFHLVGQSSRCNDRSAFCSCLCFAIVYDVMCVYVPSSFAIISLYKIGLLCVLACVLSCCWSAFVPVSRCAGWYTDCDSVFHCHETRTHFRRKNKLNSVFCVTRSKAEGMFQYIVLI